MALKEPKNHLLSWYPAAFTDSRRATQEEPMSDCLTGTGAGCLRTAARGGQRKSPALRESPRLEMTACPKYYDYRFSCSSLIYHGFFFQHLSKPSTESTRGCMMFLSINLSLQHSWVSQREQLTFWFPTQPAACNPRLPKSEEYKTLASTPHFNFLQQFITSLQLPHTEQPGKFLNTPLASHMEATATVFFYYSFQGLRQSRPKKKKRAPKIKLNLGKKKEVPTFHRQDTCTECEKPHERKKEFIFQTELPWKTYWEQCHLQIYIYTTYIHTCLYAHTLSIYTNYFKHIRAECCLKFHIGTGKWEIKFTSCSKSTGTAHSFNNFPILFLSFSIKQPSPSSGSLCNSSTDGFALVISHSYGNRFSNEVNNRGSVLCCSIAYILILQQCEVVVKWCLTNWLYFTPTNQTLGSGVNDYAECKASRIRP